MIISINIDEQNFKTLNTIKGETKISISKIINFLISKYAVNNKDIKIKDNDDLLDIKKINLHEPIKQIRVRLTKQEYDFLSISAKKNGFNLTSKEIRYRLLNTINKNKYYTNLELEDFCKSRSEINTIGRNLNSLVKLLRTRNIIKFDDENFKKSIESLNTKIDNLSNELSEILIRSNQRY
ncbi:hypothetical protein GZ989_011115 (plasmid) [Campylobacter fetus]|uniref:Cpp18 n=2 Tax=Campylobacter TaxID=194 RepID=A0A9W5ES65_CAMHY|nr:MULTISPECIES: hypothetical protein [Campylobacter]MBC3779836.1 hypothetical protein [Campylobacter fetus subsp. fetus]MBC3782210.1 hypothetical protein [Campylobacter fetus subsp. venerealis]OCS32540.1 hypothetical protein AWR31_09660 [Campylobacter fetus subsp. venerealis]OCS33137.1 hypothetical protein AWR29_08760 [Campylobacter fetus subsp. venerealis]QMS59868.1 hypothetical protein GZ989_011115 [Campylobacter fetus]